MHPSCFVPCELWLAPAALSLRLCFPRHAMQLVWGPAMTLVFFAFLKTLEGRPDLILHTVSAGQWGCRSLP